MPERGLGELARIERRARRGAQRAATDLAEAIYAALENNVSREAIGQMTELDEAELDTLLAREANRVYNRKYNRARWTAVRAGEIEPYHGNSEAASSGCTCERCMAWRERLRIREADRRASGLPAGDPRHGKPDGYRRWGCRCADCRRANSDDRNPRRRQRQPRRERRESDSPGPWTTIADAEPEQWRKIRRQAAVTMTDLARHLGVDAAQLSRWESGKVSPKPEARSRYLDALNHLAAERRKDV